MHLTIRADTVFVSSDDCCKCHTAETLQAPAGYVFINSAVQDT